ncbi:MAG: GIY-YIG nuclease family protein [Bdellovibrionota bacterium]
MREIVLEFEGYWTEASESFIPDRSGVYCVYRGKHDLLERKVYLRELLYIGESDRVRTRILGHEKRALWKEHLKDDETLCYSFTPVIFDRNRVEAALIHEHKPKENWDFIHEFPFPDTAVFSTGKTALLSGCFAALESADSREWAS